MTREVLYQNKLEKHDLTKQADENGWIPLHHAASLNCLEIVKLLLEKDKYTAYLANYEGMTALHIAASYGYCKIMKEILSRSPDCCDLVDKRGWNVLHFAVEGRENVDAVDVILNDSSLSNLINEKDENGNTPFHHVAISLNESWALANHPRVDKMAFNKENHNALDIISTNKDIQLFKNGLKRSLYKSGIKRRQRIQIRKDDGKENDEEEKVFMSRLDKAKESTLVAATLIATVTFAAGFTLPGGYVSNGSPLDGTALLRENTAFQAFMITDTIALVLSTAAVFINLFLILQDDNYSRMFSCYLISFLLTTLAMGVMVIAFVTGTYAVLAHSTPLATATCVIGLSFFIFFYFLYKKTFWDKEIN